MVNRHSEMESPILLAGTGRLLGLDAGKRVHDVLQHPSGRLQTLRPGLSIAPVGQALGLSEITINGGLGGRLSLILGYTCSCLGVSHTASSAKRASAATRATKPCNRLSPNVRPPTSREDRHMAIGWFSVLKMVPWGDVISNAPKVADGAMKLWSTVAKRPSSAHAPAAGLPPAPASETQPISVLQSQLAAAESEIAELHRQMLESSNLIRALADQGAQLIRRLEVNRIRVLWLTGFLVVVGLVTAANLAMNFAL